jgi:hypothetical protein
MYYVHIIYILITACCQYLPQNGNPLKSLRQLFAYKLPNSPLQNPPQTETGHLSLTVLP